MAETAVAGAPAGLKALKPRHKLIALMAASGRTNAQIASELGMSGVGISTILKSPLMRALVDQYLQQIESKTSTSVADVIATLRGETGKTLKTILDLRDGGDKNDSVRLAAAIELFDRQVPKVHKTDESKTVRIVLDRDRLDRLKEITSEGHVRVLPSPIIIEHNGGNPMRIADPEPGRVDPLDDVIARYAAAEAKETAE
jgi:hypothetical protein